MRSFQACVFLSDGEGGGGTRLYPDHKCEWFQAQLRWLYVNLSGLLVNLRGGGGGVDKYFWPKKLGGLMHSYLKFGKSEGVPDTLRTGLGVGGAQGRMSWKRGGGGKFYTFPI